MAAFNLPGAAAAALPPMRSWLAAPLGFGVGAWPSSRVGAFVLPGVAAAALAAGALLGGCAHGLIRGAWSVAARLTSVR